VPQAYTLTLEDTLTGQTADITSSPYIFNVSANQPLRYFRIISYGEEPKKTLFAVSGTVRDSSGNLISNVRVKLTNDTFGNMTTTTDSNGKFIFTDIPPDTYNLIVHKTGYVFKPFKVVIIDTDITVDVYSTKETGKTK
jgi:protocatechuate 3,4-dioxygenase beta subunit